MAAKFDCFGLTDLVAKPEDAFRLVSLAMADGQRVRGYAGDYYRFLAGDAKVIVRTMLDETTGEEQLLGVDTHAVSQCTWDCRVVKDVTAEDADPLSRRLLVAVEGCDHTAVVDVVCADVMPNLDQGLRLNMVAFPLRLNYSDDPCTPVVEAQRDTVLLQGTVKDVKVGKTYLGLEPLTRFISTTVSTSMGDVELCHLAEMVPEAEKDLVRVGATVSALCILSGDAAVGQYAGGIVYSPEQDRELLRTFFRCGDGQRLRPVLHSKCAVTFLQNRQEGIELALSLLEAVGTELRDADITDCDFGRITSVEQTGENIPSFTPGQPCLLLKNSQGAYAFLCLMETDSVGRIRSIVITNDSRYDFEITE